jgi:hypothetical protein
MQRETPKTPEVTPYTIELSSPLDHHSPFCPMETTFARVEPHGAVVLFRSVSGEETRQFELSGAEVDALVAANRRRKATVERYQAARNRSGERISRVSAM